MFDVERLYIHVLIEQVIGAFFVEGLNRRLTNQEIIKVCAKSVSILFQLS